MSQSSGEPIVIHPDVQGDPQRIREHERQEARAETARNAATYPDDLTDSTAPTASARPEPRRERALGLDAVRGICLVGMNVAFAIPFAVLPAWMYHMQNPPPSGAYASIPGLTWQDIIFPGFVFAMAAAIPIRGTQLLAAGQPGTRIAWDAIKRAVLLYVFALIIGHVNPYYTEYYSRGGNTLAIAGFLTCFALFVRRRDDWSPGVFAWVRRAGWVATAAILFASPLLWGGTFSLLRRDHIISAIAVTYVVSIFIWLLTRASFRARIVVAALVALLKLMAPLGGVFGMVLGRSHAPAFYEPWYFELLLVAIPGLIAGDLLREWMNRPRVPAEEDAAQHTPLLRARLAAATLLGFAIPFVLLVGLYQRWLPATTFVTIGIVVAGALVLHPLRNTPQRGLTQIGAWAAALLVIGVLLEPLEGGIKKDPQTLSFLFLCGGIWLAVLLSMTILLDLVRGLARTISRPIVLAGQNAMLAYVLYMLFFSHLAYLSGIGDALTDTPGAAALRGILATALVLATLWVATRQRIVWRA